MVTYGLLIGIIVMILNKFSNFFPYHQFLAERYYVTASSSEGWTFRLLQHLIAQGLGHFVLKF